MLACQDYKLTVWLPSTFLRMKYSISDFTSTQTAVYEILGVDVMVIHLILGKEMTMEAFAQSLHAMYSIPTKDQTPAIATQEGVHDNSQKGDDYYRYPAQADQSRAGGLYPDQHYEWRARVEEEKGVMMTYL